ncbi:MAG: Ldh family oxidoreductase [Spirochaetales bacterium]|nr:Ldh family oxidoreductase [Spirochaetales bacterium]
MSVEEMTEVFQCILEKHGVCAQEAGSIANVFGCNASHGVLSHSVNRFPLMVKYLDDGLIKAGLEPERISGFKSVERWNARFGFGITSASFSMKRAMDLAREYGSGVVTTIHSNHWMRGGYYGHLAAENGFIGLCWTITGRNLVPWGASEPMIGNNPFVIAVPRKKGNLVFDSSMAQYSWGQIGEYQRRGEKLPSFGGYDSDGNLTDDPSLLLESFKALPAGLWKGSALSIILEAAACSLGQSRTVSEMELSNIVETDMTQVFMAIDPRAVCEGCEFDAEVDRIVESLHGCSSTRYPGERAKKNSDRAREEGVPIPEESWNKVIEML